MKYDIKKIEEYLTKLYKTNIKVNALRPLGAGVHGVGHRIQFTKDNKEEHLILKTLYPENFGHDHFSDRAGAFILANSLYDKLPSHIHSVDVVGLTPEGDFISIGGAREFYILMEEAQGKDYFHDLDAIKKGGIYWKGTEKGHADWQIISWNP